MATSIDSLVPDLQPYCRELLRIAGENGLQPRITSARRSIDEQRGLYDRFLRGLNPYPVAPPGTSAHETGEAFDMLVTPVDYLPQLGQIWIGWGGEWGGNRDPVHFQLPGAPSAYLLAQTKGSSFRAFAANPYGTIASAVSSLPWYVGLLAPWELTAFNDVPILRSLIDPAWGINDIHDFFTALTQ